MIEVAFSGPMGWQARWLGGSLTQSYVKQEAEGLRQVVEGESGANREAAAGPRGHDDNAGSPIVDTE